MGKVATEVLIIGGGILGTSIARELSRYKVDVTLIEKNVDFGQGMTKTSATIVCQGANVLEFRKEYKNSRLAWESMLMMEPLCKELGVPFKRIGSLELIANLDVMRYPQKLMRRIKEDDYQKYLSEIEPHQLIDRETLRSWEPNLSKKYIAALYDPNTAITDPVRLTIAQAENARQNGVNLMPGAEVQDILKGIDEFEVKTDNGSIKCRYIVNASGEWVDKIAKLADADDFVLHPVKIYFAVVDKNMGGLINHMIAPGLENTITPTVHGNIFFGGVMGQSKRHCHSTTQVLADTALVKVQAALPDISAGDIINSFVGFVLYKNFEIGWHECTVAVSRWVPRFINVSVGFPGISSSPATAKDVVGMLAKEGLKLEENPDFNPYRKAPPVFSQLSDEEKGQLIAQDPRYGHVVCRCETVTEGEIVEAIRKGATTLDGVKFRCRPGMGRCQGGFCSPRVISILARELNIPEEEVTKNGGQSRHLLYRSKELLAQEGVA